MSNGQDPAPTPTVPPGNTYAYAAVFQEGYDAGYGEVKAIGESESLPVVVPLFSR